MVRADIKRNYYADLELPNDASLEDIKKQYRKLALKYHPDRNPGKEAEIVSKFQAIQFAHEVLEDAVVKAKYDADRKRAGLVPSFTRTPSSASRAPPPPSAYTADSSAWPRPPRRTATGNGPTGPNGQAGWRPQAAAGGGATGADRFAQFPRPAPTSKKDGDSANVFTAWQNMKANKGGPAASQQQHQHQHQQQQQQPPQPPRPQPKGAFGASPQRPRPAAPPRQDTRFPSAEDNQELPKHRPAPTSAGGFGTDLPSWADFKTKNANKPGMPQSNTTRTTKKSGFDPMAGGDEGQAGSTANYSTYRARTRSDDARAFPPPPPPPRFGEASYTSHDHSRNHDPPYTENVKVKTP